MSESDILSIQLWFGAAAIAVGAIAMTAAGWNHKLFIWSMFALSGLLALAAIFWPAIRLQIPDKLDDRLSVIANDRIAWFVMFAAAIIAMVIITRLKNRLKTAPVTRTVVQLAPIVDIQIVTTQLSHAAPWVEFYCDAFNATGYSMRLISAKGRIKIGTEEFHGQIELGKTNWGYAQDELYSFSVRVPLSQSEASYLSEISSKGHFPISFLDAWIEAIAHGPLAGTPFQIRLPAMNDTIYFDSATLHPDPPFPRQLKPNQEQS